MQHGLPPERTGTIHMAARVIEEEHLTRPQMHRLSAPAICSYVPSSLLTQLMLDPPVRPLEGLPVGLGVTEIGAVDQVITVRTHHGIQTQLRQFGRDPIGAIGEHEHGHPTCTDLVQQAEDAFVDRRGGIGPPIDGPSRAGGLRSGGNQVLHRLLPPPGMGAATSSDLLEVGMAEDRPEAAARIHPELRIELGPKPLIEHAQHTVEVAHEHTRGAGLEQVTNGAQGGRHASRVEASRVIERLGAGEPGH